jgi:DNA-binding IscR family transcriptional regulator
MIHLAGLPPGARASRAELAREAECPEQFLSKVLQSLTRAGW